MISGSVFIRRKDLNMKWLVYGLLVLLLISCEDGRVEEGGSENTSDGREIAREKVVKDVGKVDMDFNNDGVNDAIKQVTINRDGHHRVIHVYIKEPRGFVPTYDNDDNQMVYPGDSIVKVSDEKFKFMYHGGDYFVFNFEKKDGQWIAQQAEY